MSIAPRLLSLAAAAFALCATPAAADTAAPPGAVVASSAHRTLTAADDGTAVGVDQMVVTLRGTDLSNGRYTVSDHGNVPLWPDDRVSVEHSVFTEDDRTVLQVEAGAVEADVATVEVTYGKKVLRMPTTPGPGYHGQHAGQVRFYAGEIALTLDEAGDPNGTRLLDASGALVSQSGVGDGQDSAMLLRGHQGGMPIEIGARLDAYDAPLPLDPAHVDHDLCLTVYQGSGEERTAGNTEAACQDDGDVLE